jgi:nucleoside-diphosphate-sugar epimerase
MKTVLVTGGSGFIGGAVVERLAARGDRVIAFDLSESARLRDIRKTFPNIVFVPGELTEWPQLAQVFKDHKPDSVVHCAAIVGVVLSLASPIATMRVNVEGSLNVMSCMRLFGVHCMVNISSEEIYGSFDSNTITEDHPCHPQQPYGISKLAVEQLGRDFTRAGELSVINLRTCWVYGPALPRPRIPRTLIDAAIEGKPLHMESGADFRVDHVYIDDVADGIILALDHPTHRFDAYHITTGVAPSLGEMASIVRELVPGADISIGPGHYAFKAGVAPVHKGALDCSRARGEFGYLPKFDIRAGLKACVDARRKELR